MSQEDIKKYSEELFGIIKGEVKDLWKIEDEDFLKGIAQDISIQQINLKLAISDDERERCKKNLEHLQTQIKGRIAGKKNQLIDKGDATLTKIINVAIKVGSALLLG
jgi:hypothetical protein